MRSTIKCGTGWSDEALAGYALLKPEKMHGWVDLEALAESRGLKGVAEELRRRKREAREACKAESVPQGPACPICGRGIPIGVATLVCYGHAFERLCGWCASWSLPLTVRD